MKRRVIDVSGLPPIAFGARDPHWWGVALLIAIEGTMLALLTISYFYVQARTSPWPPELVGPSVPWAGAIELGLLLLSCPPTWYAGRAARQGDLRGMRLGLIVATLLAVGAAVCRGWLLDALPFRWDDSAYGSVVWLFLGLHVVHGLTGILENGALIALLYKGPVEEKHRVDVDVTSALWYFVVAGELLVTAVIYRDFWLHGRFA